MARLLTPAAPCVLFVSNGLRSLCPGVVTADGFPLELLQDIWGKDPKPFAALYQQVSGFPARAPGSLSRGGHCISGSGESRMEMGEQVELLLGRPRLSLPLWKAAGLLLLSQLGGGETQLAVMKRPPGQIRTHHPWLGASV